MIAFLVQRLLGLVGMLLVLHAAIFWSMELIPGSPVDRQLGEHATAQARENLTRKLGLDAPAPQRYLRHLQRTFLYLDLQLEASRTALEQAGVDPGQLSLVMATTSTPHKMTSTIAAALGAELSHRARG